MATTSYGRGGADGVSLFEQVEFPHSLGLLYSTITGYLGFRVNDGEYKVMGLAPYGQPRYLEQMRTLLRSEPGGQYRLNLEYFDFLRGTRMHSDRLAELLGGPARAAESEITQRHQDVARSLQVLLEETLLEKARWLHERVPSPNLCMSGGVALNCVANGRILREGPFQRLFVQPAAGDAGGALGAAALAHAQVTGSRLPRQRLRDVYLGPRYDAASIAELLQALGVGGARPSRPRAGAAGSRRGSAGRRQGRGLVPRRHGVRAARAGCAQHPGRPAGCRHARAAQPAGQEARGVPPLRAERAAGGGGRALRAGPSVRVHAGDLPGALAAGPARRHARRRLGRPQTVDAAHSPRYAALIRAFAARTGCPLLVNTSFNVRGEPIVCAPTDALVTMAESDIDCLVLEDFVIDRAARAR